MSTKNISLDSYFNIVFNDIIFGNTHERFVSSIYSQNLTQYTMGTGKPGRRNRCHVNVPTRNKLDLFGSTASLGVWRGIGQREVVL